MRKGTKMSEESKKKISLAHSGKNNYFYGKHHTEEVKKTMSEKLKGKTFEERFGKKKSDEIKLKISKRTKGRKLTEEHKKKISLSKTNPSEKIRKIYSLALSGENNGMFGKKASKETREKH